MTTDNSRKQKLELKLIFETWYEAIKTIEGQHEMIYSMTRIRKSNMKQYKTFFDRILGELDKLSVNHAEAYRYWIRRGNLVNVDSESDSYPNVTLTCRNPLFEDGKFMNYSISNNYFLLKLKKRKT